MTIKGINLLSLAINGDISAGNQYTNGDETIEALHVAFFKISGNPLGNRFETMPWTYANLKSEWTKVEQRPELDDWEKEFLRKAYEYGYTTVIKNGLHQKVFAGSPCDMAMPIKCLNSLEENELYSIAWLLGEEE